jgi:hypothetical protein
MRHSEQSITPAQCALLNFFSDQGENELYHYFQLIFELSFSDDPDECASPEVVAAWGVQVKLLSLIHNLAAEKH